MNSIVTYRKTQTSLWQAIKYFVLILASIIVILPIIVIFAGSFKTGDEFNHSGPFALPSFAAGFSNYVTAFTKGNMLRGFSNTMILIIASGIGTMLTGSMTAYILNRFSFKLNKYIKTMFLWVALIPTITAQVATFQIVQKLGLYNTRLSVIILSMGTDIISIMIYLQFLDNISKSLDESAIIDGASYWQVFFKVIFPLLQPATVTVLILKSVNLYNDFYNPLLYMPKQTLMVISTSLYKFQGPFGTNWPVICAGVVIAVIPTLIIFLSLQKYIYSGMVAGSVKE